MMKSSATIVLMAAALSLCSCKVKEDVRSLILKTAPEQQKVLVKVQKVEFSDNVGTASYVGTVEASRTAVVSARNSGTVTGLCLKVGDRVSRGQELCVIESAQVRSAYDAARATLLQAEDGWERIEKVRSSRSVTEVKVVEVQTKFEQARASAAAASRSVDEMTLRAPFDAVVNSVAVSDGTNVNIAESIVALVDPSSAEIHFPLPENEYAVIGIGTGVSVEIPALGITDLKASVSAKAAVASKLSRSYDCIVSLPSIPRSLMPGMVCKISVGSVGARVFVLPASAVMTDTEGRYVWTVEDGVVGRSYVTVGGYNGDGVVIKSGLQEGDSVIVEGSRKVSTGMSVKAVK